MKILKKTVEIKATDIVLTFEEALMIKDTLIWAEVLGKESFEGLEKKAKECRKIINNAIINQ